MRKITLAFLAVAAAGCAEDIDSDEVATDGIYANFVITAVEGTSRVAAVLKAGGIDSNTYLELTENDALVAYAGEFSETMAESDSFDYISYHADFPVDEEDTLFKVSFLRSHAEDEECNGVSAPNSTVTLPAPFTITAPTGGSFSRADDPIDLTWTGSGENDPLYWSASGSCIQTVLNEEIEDDDGSFQIPAGTIVGVTTSSCTMTLSVSRTRAGDLDPAYGEGGSIAAQVVREVDVESQP